MRKNIILRKIIDAAKSLNEKGMIAIVATVSHKKEMRLEAREKITKFMEVELLCEHTECAKRDYKNLYMRAYNNEFEVLWCSSRAAGETF